MSSVIDIGNREHGFRIAEAAGVGFDPARDIVICRVKDGELLGGVIFTDWTGKSIAGHMAGFHPQWINPDMLYVTFDYPFNQLGCEALFGFLKVTNEHALDFDRKLGFKEVARIADVYPEGDMVVMKMLRSECRWLNIKPRTIQGNSSGQKVRSARSA